MGCCASAEEVQEVPQEEQFTEKQPAKNAEHMEDLRFDIARAEKKSIEAGPEQMTFLSSVLDARRLHSDNTEIMKDACQRLKAHNDKLKSFIATADAQAVHEAMNGGFMGMGCNHEKLIAVLCSRTKAQLQTTKSRYRSLYDADIVKEVQGETGGDYGKMMAVAMRSPTDYVIEMMDLACAGWGCDEEILIQLFVMHTQAELKEGKEAWEGRRDKSFIVRLRLPFAPTAPLPSAVRGHCCTALSPPTAPCGTHLGRE